MGFAEAANSPNDKAIVAALQNALPTQAFQNMDSDPLIPDSMGTSPAPRLDLIRSLDPGPQIADDANAFCHGHQQEGPDSTTAQGAVLGCVRKLRYVADRVAAKRSISQAEAEAALRSSMAIADPTVRLADQQGSLRAPNPATGRDEPFALSQYQLWAFYDQPSQSPSLSIGTTRAGAVDRLGLGDFQSTNDELLYWEHRVPPGKTAHQPTAWDADAKNVYWRPGGKTYPLSGNAALGLREVVHDPVTADDLVTPISPLT